MLRLSTLLLVLAALLPALLASQVSYEGHKYVRVNTDSEKIHQWFFDDFDVLRARRSAFDLHVSPAQLELLSALDLDVQILHDNVQRLIELDMPRASAERAEVSLNSTWFSDYHRYDEVKAWYQELARANSGATFISSIGKSHQNRDLFAFTFGTAGKPGIFIQGRQHAREWIGGAALDYLVWHFLTQDKSLLNDFQFIIVPIVNPDGYEYSWTNDRLWRKNRRNNGSTYGVDLNRNWNSHWGQGGSSSNPASDTYMGPSVASEPEVQAVSKFFLTYTNIIAGFDFHAYSQLILRPYGWKNGNAEHETVLFAAAEIIQEEIKAVHGKDFENIHSIELYVTTGTTSDWFYDDEVKAKLGHRIYAYTLELRPSTAIPGFNLPPDQIIPSGEELVPALKAFVTYANSNQIRT